MWRGAKLMANKKCFCYVCCAQRERVVSFAPSATTKTASQIFYGIAHQIVVSINLASFSLHHFAPTFGWWIFGIFVGCRCVLRSNVRDKYSRINFGARTKSTTGHFYGNNFANNRKDFSSFTSRSRARRRSFIFTKMSITSHQIGCGWPKFRCDVIRFSFYSVPDASLSVYCYARTTFQVNIFHSIVQFFLLNTHSMRMAVVYVGWVINRIYVNILCVFRQRD